MSDTPASPLRKARDHKGYSREFVARELEPPISSKTLERWEDVAHTSAAPGWRLEQLAEIYGVAVATIEDGKVAA